MGYYLKAFIGKRDVLSLVQTKFEEAHEVELSNEISMIPMTDELFDEINNLVQSESVDKFEFMTTNVENRIIQIIGNNQLAYFESEFFGGEGGHQGLIWKNGKRDFLSDFNKNSLNEILNKLKVPRHSTSDEFTTLGLGRYRQTDDWVK